ncbi:MAG TPA: DUF3796 domain-containing protein [Bacillota bacterium]|nr:DUF3796 domain-containing protein [Bacillota bacterium]
MKRKKRSRYMGFLGFLGFAGFSYFQDHNIAALSYFAFFGFFAYFWIGSIAADMVDERYVENSRNAKALTLNVALIEFIILYLATPLDFVSKEILTVACALCFASLIISYGIAFYIFEKM